MTNWELGIVDRSQMREWMVACRQSTLSLFTEVDYSTFCCQAHPDFSPIGWHLGHIAYTEGLWILEHLAGVAPQFPEYRRLFAADTLPKCDRVNLPTLAEVQSYLATIRTQVFEYLLVAPLETQKRLWLWLIQHESQHCETIAIVLALQGKEGSGRERKEKEGETQESGARLRREHSAERSHEREGNMLLIPAGEFEMGNESPIALDNERPVQRVYVDEFWIDRTTVTCEQYRQFIQSGGYENARWWSKAGWHWLQASLVQQPLYWVDDSAFDHHPVYGVSWYEAEAYAQFVNKRLPTEAEWEKAANQFPDLLLNSTNRVWEWTASWFDGYPGFAAYPYRGYSQAYFDGKHRVLRGGSWATQPWAYRSTFRNWYYPQVREIFAGFRCAR